MKRSKKMELLWKIILIVSSIALILGSILPLLPVR